jgi:hypothetical protein
MLSNAHDALAKATGRMNAVVDSALAADQQKRRLLGTAGGALIAGMLLWATLAGAFARALPGSWHAPERMAARTLRLDSWSAGEHLLAAAEPERWQTVVTANRILQDNRDAVVACLNTSVRGF